MSFSLSLEEKHSKLQLMIQLLFIQITFDSFDSVDALLSCVQSDPAVAQAGDFFALFGVVNRSWRGSVAP